MKFFPLAAILLAAGAVTMVAVAPAEAGRMCTLKRNWA